MRNYLAALTLAICLLLQGSGAAARHAAPHTHNFRAFVTGYLWSGYRTATGIWPRWGVVATDPSVIPLGAHLTISGLRGVFHAEDTGGLIRGARVDVFCWSLAQAYALTGYHEVRWWE